MAFVEWAYPFTPIDTHRASTALQASFCFSHPDGARLLRLTGLSALDLDLHAEIELRSALQNAREER